MLLKIKQSGFSLIELMLSVTIGSLLILGASYAFQEAKRTYSVNDSVSRLQEQAQFVLSVLEEDVRLSNFWGLHNRRGAVVPHTSVQGLAFTGDCANNWALDIRQLANLSWDVLDDGIIGTNNVDPTDAALSVNAWGDGCITASEYLANTDTLVIRHADTIPIPDADLQAGRVYLTSLETPSSTMFLGTTVPAGTSALSSTYEMRSHGYYVRNFSFEDAAGNAIDNVPMLRRITLTDGGAAPVVQDQELAIGVEDFQIEFGVDTSPLVHENRNSINRYVAPDNDMFDPTHANFNPEVQILSVRVWLMLRAQNAELNYTNTDTYSYADKTGADAFTPAAGDAFRRLLVSRTFFVRNMER